MAKPNDGRFKPGKKPWNTGLKGVTGVQAGCKATQFKKGRPAIESRNYVPIGSLRISADGLLERKVTDDPTLYPARRWVGVHRLVWESVNGPIPKGHLVVFKSGRKTTDIERITIDALELITRVENMRRNTIHNRYPKELADLARLRGVLTRQINRKEKERGES